MKRILVSALVAGPLLAAAPHQASAQVSVAVHLSWHWSDDGWRPTPVADGYVTWREARITRRARPPVRVRPAGFRVPPGHMPPPGLCRLWFVGRPPGHQPRPDACARVFRMRPRADVIILHSPARGDRWWRDRYREDGGWAGDDDRWDLDRDRWGRDEGWHEERRGRKGRGGGPRG